MGSMRKFGAAVVIAGVMAGGLGSATLEAKKPGSGGDPKDAICQYLKAIIDFQYTSPYILPYVLSLYSLYGCE